MVKEQETIEKLEKLGFKRASGIVKELSEKKRKLAIAYEHYRFVRQGKVDAFNKNLREETLSGGMFQQLTFTPVGDYPQVPPMSVLASLETAMERNCFDHFEIAHIVQVKEDPILFGRINCCNDFFFIDQWDSDISIDQLLGPTEG